MKPDRVPLRKIEESFDELARAALYKALDLFSGYWQMQLSEEFKEMKTFVCRIGTLSSR